MRVAVAAHGRFHAFRLAAELHRRRCLAVLLTTYPAGFVRRTAVADLPVRSAPWLELQRRLQRWLNVDLDADYLVARRFAHFAARHLPAGDVLVGWSGATLEAIEPARRRGFKIVIERGSTHIAHQAEVLAREYQDFGVPFTAIDGRLIERETAEYDAADAIAVPSRAAARTFIDRGFALERLIVNPYGAELHPHAAVVRGRMGGPVRILFVGSLSLRKGVPWLLRAFARIRAPAELHLVGPTDADAAAVIAREPSDRVVFHGPLRGTSLERAYADADIFCLPSLEEGFSLAVLEAMGMGLPVVITAETGATDRVEAGREGFVVPGRDPVALGEALESLIADPDRRRAMGEAARRRIAQDTTWADYGDRAVAAYRQLLGEHAPTVAAVPACP